MMLKQQEIEQPNSTWNKAKPDEPVFIIRGQDAVAAQAILDWAMRAQMAGASAEKVAYARIFAGEVREWQAVRGTKIPD